MALPSLLLRPSLALRGGTLALVLVGIGSLTAAAQAQEASPPPAANDPVITTTTDATPGATVQAETPPAVAPTPLYTKVTPAPEDRPSTFVRILGELGGAAIGAGIGSLPLYIAVASVENNNCDFGCAFSSIYLGVIGFAVLTTAAVTVGTYLAGETLGGDGRFWLTLLGTAGGALLSTLILTEVADSNDGDGLDLSLPAFVALIDIGPILGSILVYELTNRAGDDDVAVAPQTGVRWTPVMAALPNAQGGMLGVRGSF